MGVVAGRHQFFNLEVLTIRFRVRSVTLWVVQWRWVRTVEMGTSIGESYLAESGADHIVEHGLEPKRRRSGGYFEELRGEFPRGEEERVCSKKKKNEREKGKRTEDSREG